MHEKRFAREIERLRDPERITRLEVNRVVTLVLEDLNGPLTVLDVGTGTGLFAEQFSSRGLAVTGLDANPAMLSAAQEYVPAVVFREGTAENLPFEDGAFDIVFMGLLLHETDNMVLALQEARRVALKRLSILEWPEEAQDFGPPPEHRLSNEKINSLALQVGFNSVSQIRLANLVLYSCDK
jgi:ubiquinone/menaquinone biosynthesis C-methylase UbiE